MKRILKDLFGNYYVSDRDKQILEECDVTLDNLLSKAGRKHIEEVLSSWYKGEYQER